MNMIVKVLFKQLTKLMFAACTEHVIKWLIFELLEMAAKHSKTHFDDELIKKIKEVYDEKELDDADPNSQ